MCLNIHVRFVETYLKNRICCYNILIHKGCDIFTCLNNHMLQCIVSYGCKLNHKNETLYIVVTYTSILSLALSLKIVSNTSAIYTYRCPTLSLCVTINVFFDIFLEHLYSFGHNSYFMDSLCMVFKYIRQLMFLPLPSVNKINLNDMFWL